MTDRQFKTLKLILELLIFGVDLIILAIGLTNQGTVGYTVDGLAGLLFVLLGVVSVTTE